MVNLKSYVHNVAVFTQREKQFTLSSLVENNLISKPLSSFLSNFSRPIRGINGSLAYHTDFQGHDLFIHPISVLQKETERRDRITQSMVQIVFQEDETPFSPEFLGDDLETMCFIVITPIKSTGDSNHSSSKNCRYKVSILTTDEISEFNPKMPELPVLSSKQLKDVMIPLLINANISCFKSRRMNSLRCRARAELFASLYEVLSGWNSQEGTYTGHRLADLIKIPKDRYEPPLANNQAGRNGDFGENQNFKFEKSRSDSGHSSNYYSRNELFESKYEFVCVHVICTRYIQVFLEARTVYRCYISHIKYKFYNVTTYDKVFIL